MPFLNGEVQTSFIIDATWYTEAFSFNQTSNPLAYIERNSRFMRGHAMSLRRLLANKGGNVATIFALSLLPMAGAAGLAVDYTRAASLKNELQKAADATALAVVMAKYESRTLNAQEAFNTQFQAGVTYEGLNVNGSWTVPGRIYRVSVAAASPTTLMSIITPSLDVSAAASAELLTGIKIKLDTAMMDPEAGDYNELRFYCFKQPKNGKPGERLGPIDSTTGIRVDPIKFADNSPAGIKAGLAQNPQEYEKYYCADDEVLSYQMHNIRDARTLDNPYGRENKYHYDYYTDTVEKNGKVTFNTNPADIIETIYCDTKIKCTTPKSKGGLIPDQKRNREPQVNTAVCTNGFMYMGWEDRQKTGDRDYDDIRIVMQCEDRDNISKSKMKARLVE